MALRPRLDVPENLPRFLTFATFTQNLAWGMPGAESGYFFAVSWSLAVEEWFYLLFGVLLIGGAIVMSWRRALALSLALFILGPLAHRFLDPTFPTNGLFSAVIFRLDSIAYGVGLAALYRYWPRFFAAPWLCLAAGVSMVLAGWFHYLPLNRTLHPPLIHVAWAIGTALCFPAALRLTSAPRILAAPIQAISRQAYGLYIMHATILVHVIQPLVFGKQVSPVTGAILAVGLPFVASYLSYRFFEAPILHWRPQQKLGPHGAYGGMARSLEATQPEARPS